MLLFVLFVPLLMDVMDIAKQIVIEAAREHPFFVRSKGWCSCSPQRTLDCYGLACQELVIGDCCIALCQVELSKFNQLLSSAVASSAAKCERFSKSGETQLDSPIDYSTTPT